MAGVFQNIDPPSPSPLVRGGGHTRWLERGVGWGVNILEDVRYSSVLYICKYYMPPAYLPAVALIDERDQEGEGAGSRQLSAEHKLLQGSTAVLFEEAFLSSNS